MNIGIDIDDTISDTYATLFEYAQKYTIEELKKNSEINKNKVANHFYIESIHNWTEKEASSFWNKYYIDILNKVNIKTFASDKIKQLKQEGDEINLITARWSKINSNVEQITKDWLKINNIEYDKLFLDANEKLNVVKQNNIDVFIDDSFNNCRSIAYGSKAKVFLMDSRANQGFKDEKITRVYSWPHLYREITKLKEENK